MKPESFKGIIPDTSPELLSWRSATGNDYRDEVWDGVYHVVSEKVPKQLLLENELESWLLSNWIVETGGRLFRDTRIASGGNWQSDFRVPSFSLFVDFPDGAYEDHLLTSPPDVVVEFATEERFCIQKINFYCQLGVQEVWVIDVFSGICEIIGCDNRRMIPTVDSALDPVTSPVTGVCIKTEKDVPGYSIYGRPDDREEAFSSSQKRPR